jgi:hypothetical protein
MTSLEERQRRSAIGAENIHLDIKIVSFYGLEVITNTCCNCTVMNDNLIVFPIHINVFEVFFLYIYMGLCYTFFALQ